jgi:hypothetical protein
MGGNVRYTKSKKDDLRGIQPSFRVKKVRQEQRRASRNQQRSLLLIL